MDIILWRHAEAAPGFPDHDRVLTEKGAHDAGRMARWLRPRLPGSSTVLVSPARRAQQTAAALTSEYATDAGIGTSASVEIMRDTVLKPLPVAAVIVVSHQPTLGQLAAQLLSGQLLDWSMKPGAICWLTYYERAGAGKAELRAMMSPEFLD
ncbi:MAG: histidine phosphatase family protein [Burkholderiales bacterium]|nr:histidine phosphatase family protein [Burkholderiales bacterium]